ncbi:MAG: molybdopterin synthase sulfur carrier subunit [Devosia sp.]|jgi:molybdopterin synthase sulfur carrier subunit|nr:molybdopterin synthase sulfur carrier subunit [Devosia sp.]
MKILYFAWLRERLNRSEEEVTLPPEVQTAGDLLAWLATRDEALALALEKPAQFKVSRDARIIGPEASILGANTVAILPPMTGG